MAGPSSPRARTPAGTTVWIWTGDSPTALTVNGVAQAGSWLQAGGGSSSYKFMSPWFATEPDHATTFVTFTGDAGTLTITHGCAPEPGPDADADAGRHPDADADADAGRHADAVADADAGRHADADPDADAGRHADTHTHPDTDPDPDPDAGRDAVRGANTHADAYA